MSSYMAVIYVNLIRKGKKTIEQVPPVIRDEVVKCLTEQEAS